MKGGTLDPDAYYFVQASNLLLKLYFLFLTPGAS